jgi:hypothetical protein
MLKSRSRPKLSGDRGRVRFACAIHGLQHRILRRSPGRRLGDQVRAADCAIAGRSLYTRPDVLADEQTRRVIRTLTHCSGAIRCG